MKPKRSKYDTNPLDDKVADRADQSWSPPTEDVGAATREIGSRQANDTNSQLESEAPTRRIDGDFATTYPSVFVPPPVRQPDVYQPPRMPPQNIYQPPPGPLSNVYQAPPRPLIQPQTSRTVAGLGIPEKWANMLPYAPFHIGSVVSVLELLLVSRSEPRTRFHAAQGLALQIVLLVLTGMFQFINLITGSSAGSKLFWVASTVFLIISMVRAWKGQRHHIQPLDEPARWFDEKIKPRNP